MGRSDGTGRRVSPPGADDADTGILHIDMDAFFAAVEVLHDPTLAGKAVVIGAPDGRSVVSSASYEARRYGVRSAMPMARALQLCPRAIVVVPHFERYRDASAQVMEIFRSFTPLVEPLSIDEAFLDVRGARRLWGSPGEIAGLIREKVLRETGLNCSVGVAATKHVAKMASTMAKPDGVLIVPGAETLDFLEPLSVRSVWGVGPRAAEALESRAVRTIGDIRRTPAHVLERALGASGARRVAQLAVGQDPREVQTERTEKSIGHEETFEDDIADDETLRAELLRLADRVAVRLRRGGFEAAAVAIKVRFADFTTITRSQTLAEPTDVGQRISEAARELFDAIGRHDPVRLIGVRTERLQPAGSSAIALWDDDKDWRRVEGALDDAVAKFGDGALTRATFLGRGARPARPPENSD